MPRAGSAAAEALPWPARVPILSAADLSPPGAAATEARRPLWGWLLATFPDSLDPDATRHRMHAIVAAELFLVQVEDLGLPRPASLMDFSVAHPGLVAVLWNRTMARLGYDVPEDKLNGKVERR